MYYKQKNYATAESLFSRVLVLEEKAFGPDNPKIIFNIDNLAKLYEIEGKYAEAVPLFLRSLALDEKESGPGGFNAATRTKNLVQLYRKMGSTQEAEALDKRGVANGLLTAAKEGNVAAVQAALEAGADVNAREVGRGENGNTPLHFAAKKGHLLIVKLLLEKGAVVDARNKEMNTPLMLSINNDGTLDVVKYLVEHGADIQAKDNKGMITLEHVSYSNRDYAHSLKRKLLGKNKYEVFGKVIKFSDVQLSNGGYSFWVGRTDEKCTLLINGKLTDIPVGTGMYPGTFAGLLFPVDISLTVGANDIVFAKNEKVYVSFDEKSGNLITQIGVLAKDMALTVGSLKIPFHAKRYDPEYAQYRGQASMHFHDNGVISEAYVSVSDFTIKVGANEIPFKGDEIMKFYENGGIKSGELSRKADLAVGENKITFNYSISTYPNGSIRTGTLSQDTSLPVGKNRINFKKGTNIAFFEDGNVKSGTVIDEIGIRVDGKIKTMEKQELYFKPDGTLKNIYEGYKYKKTGGGGAVKSVFDMAE